MVDDAAFKYTNPATSLHDQEREIQQQKYEQMMRRKRPAALRNSILFILPYLSAMFTLVRIDIVEEDGHSRQLGLANSG